MYVFYPARAPKVGTPEYLSLTGSVPAGEGRTALEQSGYQLAALGVTLGVAIVGGLITGFILKLPIFEQIQDQPQLFDDEAAWHVPDDYKLKIKEVKLETQ